MYSVPLNYRTYPVRYKLPDIFFHNLLPFEAQLLCKSSADNVDGVLGVKSFLRPLGTDMFERFRLITTTGGFRLTFNFFEAGLLIDVDNGSAFLK